jgi:hypothetical protein
MKILEALITDTLINEEDITVILFCEKFKKGRTSGAIVDKCNINEAYIRDLNELGLICKNKGGKYIPTVFGRGILQLKGVIIG